MEKNSFRKNSIKKSLVSSCLVWRLILILSLILSSGFISPSFAGDNGSKTSLGQNPFMVDDQFCLSLKALANEAKKKTLRSEVINLAGVGWLDGYVIDPPNQDIILIGRRSSKRPPLHLDDLVVNFNAIWNGRSFPYCSLDPRPEDVANMNKVLSGSGTMTSLEQMRRLYSRIKETWGPQMVVVGGVPKNSRHARTMIFADYHMKKLSQALVNVAGIPSYLELSLKEARESAERGKMKNVGMSMSRFWFHIAKGHPTFRESDGIIWLDQCSVAVLTERQRSTADGKLYDSGEDDPNARAFAGILSDRFQQATMLVPEYAELENLFRLTALLQAMYFRSAPQISKLDLNFYLSEFGSQVEPPMPLSLPGLVNSKEERVNLTQGNYQYQYVFFPIVCGGVSMEIPLSQGQFTRTYQANLNQLRMLVLKSRPSNNALWWPLTKL